MKCVLCRGSLDENGRCNDGHRHWSGISQDDLIQAITELQRRLYFVYKAVDPEFGADAVKRIREADKRGG